MYKGFYINLDEISELINLASNNDVLSSQNQIIKKSNDIFKLDSEKIINHINNLSSNILDGENLLKSWFPLFKKEKFHIFLSHSHKDIDLVSKFAGWLYDNLNLKCFIDSAIWQNAKEIKKVLNEQINEKRDYDKINDISSQIDNMLLSSLNLMMDSCEVVFFLKSKNSISNTENEYFKTLSPWIFSELVFTKTLCKKIPKRHSEMSIGLEGYHKKSYTYGEQFFIQHPAYLDSLKQLSFSDFQIWSGKMNHHRGNAEKNLDFLYQIVDYYNKWR